MPHDAWLDRVAQELAGRGLPAVVRRRLLAELRDHLHDLTEGGETMLTKLQIDRRMGEPHQLADAAITNYRQSSWVRRHPWLVFGIAALPITLTIFVAYVLVMGLGASGIGRLVYGSAGLEALPRETLFTLAQGFAYSVGIVPFLLSAWFFSRLAMRTRVSGWWLALAIVQVALLAGAANANVVWSDTPGQSSFALNFGFPPSAWQVGQLFLPLILGALCMRAMVRREVAMA